MVKIKKILFGLCLSCAFAGCEKTFELYMGFNLQPKNINSVYLPGLNIFGMLKTGPTYDTLNHFFEVQQILPVFDTATLFAVDSAIIELTRIRNNGETTSFSLSPYGDGRYTHEFLDVQPGDGWNYQCRYDTVTITSQTQIPNEPAILEGSLNVTTTNVSFIIIADATAFMYDIYYIDDRGFYTKRIVPQQSINTDVSLDIVFAVNSQINQLFIYGYDKNYEAYVTTSNIFFKPNAFRPRFTTVDGGYGCFCSVSCLLVDLKE